MTLPSWRLPADDPGDLTTLVTLSAQMGLPTMEIELIDGDGHMSPARARRLAMLLTEAASQAEQYTVYRSESA